MKTLIIAEIAHQKITSGTLSTISAGMQLGGELDVLMMGSNIQALAKELIEYEGVSHVLQAEHSAYDHGVAENVASLIINLAEDYTHILAPASTFGKNIMPRVAALKDVAQLSDVTTIIDNNTFIHPIYAGDILETVQMLDALKILTIRTTAFEAAKKTNRSVPIEIIDLVFENQKIEFISSQKPELVRPELGVAKIVVSGGRGLQSAENFKKLEAIADKLHAAIGASRAAVDAGFVPNDYQVGQTGKIVAPDLYIAIGISGAIQHVAGMKASKIIVAINKDPDAPIFQIADYGLVGDLFTVLPELETALEDSKSDAR